MRCMHIVSINSKPGVLNNANGHVLVLHAVCNGNLVVEVCQKTCVLEVWYRCRGGLIINVRGVTTELGDLH